MLLLRQIEVFLLRNRMAPTTFGRLATRDPRFVLDLRNGRQPTPPVEQRVEHFMNSYAGAAHAC